MAHGIYLSMGAASARLRQLDSIADNLANAETPGFKASRAAFHTMLPTASDPSRTARDDYATAVAADGGLDLRPGTIKTTGRELDVLPREGLFLGVTQEDGSIGFTRDGRLQVSSDGSLLAGGRPVVDDAGVPLFVPPNLNPIVKSDGTLVVRTGRGREVPLGQLGMFQLQGPAKRINPSTVAPGKGGIAVPTAGVIDTGQTELANFSTLDAAVQMVSAQRAFEHATQAIDAYRTLDQQATSSVGRVDI